MAVGGQTGVVDKCLIFISLSLWQTKNYILSSTSVILHPDKNQHLASFQISFFFPFTSLAKVKKVTWKERWNGNTVQIEGL